MALTTCDVFLGNTGKTCRKYIGLNDGLIFSKTRQEIATVETAALEATYTALIQTVAATGRIYPINFEMIEIANNEPQFEENTFSGSVYLYSKGGKDKFKLRNPSDWDKFNLLMGEGTRNADLYVWRIFSLNAIRGIYDSTRIKFQMEKVSVKKYFEKPTDATSEYMVLEVESLEGDKAEDYSVTVEPEFQLKDLEGLLDVVVVDNGSEVGTVKVKVNDKATGSNDIIDLDLSVLGDSIIVKIAGVPTAPTSQSLEGDTYELVNTAYIAGDVTVELGTPDVLGLNYEMYGDPITITLS